MRVISSTWRCGINLTGNIWRFHIGPRTHACPTLTQVRSTHYRIQRGADEASQIRGCSEQRQKHTYSTVFWIDIGIYENITASTTTTSRRSADPENKYKNKSTQPGYICATNRLPWSYTPIAHAKKNTSMLKLTR